MLILVSILSFTCPHCEDYNGWDSQGDYNKQMDMGVGGKARLAREQVVEETAGNGHCRNWNLNQELKVS